MNITALPSFVEDVVKLCDDIKAAEALLAPQYPNLISDAEKLKLDGEKLLA